jgi:hypothetical protein
LILTPQTPLTPADRAWLLEHCRAWATKLDAHLTAVEANEDPEKVREAADQTIRALIKALHDRADRLS